MSHIAQAWRRDGWSCGHSERLESIRRPRSTFVNRIIGHESVDDVGCVAQERIVLIYKNRAVST